METIRQSRFAFNVYTGENPDLLISTDWCVPSIIDPNMGRNLVVQTYQGIGGKKVVLMPYSDTTDKRRAGQIELEWGYIPEELYTHLQKLHAMATPLYFEIDDFCRHLQVEPPVVPDPVLPQFYVKAGYVYDIGKQLAENADTYFLPSDAPVNAPAADGDYTLVVNLAEGELQVQLILDGELLPDYYIELARMRCDLFGILTLLEQPTGYLNRYYGIISEFRSSLNKSLQALTLIIEEVQV
jgi:hypothetical protein